jgi:hypothetical protein
MNKTELMGMMEVEGFTPFNNYFEDSDEYSLLVDARGEVVNAVFLAHFADTHSVLLNMSIRIDFDALDDLGVPQAKCWSGSVYLQHNGSNEHRWRDPTEQHGTLEDAVKSAKYVAELWVNDIDYRIRAAEIVGEPLADIDGLVVPI